MTSLAGSFLVARPVLQDPSFRHTVVLVLQHGPDGAFGLVVNRTKQVEGLPFPVFLGGPCEFEGLLLLHGHADWGPSEGETSSGQVAPGIFLGDASCLERVSDATADESLRFRVFRGYSGWAPQQLESELQSGAWVVLPAHGQLLFDTPIEELWARLVPKTIPQPSVN
jgi:putative transcriptional regulator